MRLKAHATAQTVATDPADGEEEPAPTPPLPADPTPRRHAVSFVPPESVSTEPICLAPALRASLLAQSFRGAAAQFRTGSIPPGRNGMGEYDLRRVCGEQVIEADRAGLIPDSLPQLRALIEWHTQPDPPETAAKIRYVRCPANLFNDVVGGHMISVRIESEGMREITDEGGRPKMWGGLMARIDPQHLARPRNEQFAAACEFLAALIDRPARRLWPRPRRPRLARGRGTNLPHPTQPRRRASRPRSLSLPLNLFRTTRQRQQKATKSNALPLLPI